MWKKVNGLCVMANRNGGLGFMGNGINSHYNLKFFIILIAYFVYPEAESQIFGGGWWSTGTHYMYFGRTGVLMKKCQKTMEKTKL